MTLDEWIELRRIETLEAAEQERFHAVELKVFGWLAGESFISTRPFLAGLGGEAAEPGEE